MNVEERFLQIKKKFPRGKPIIPTPLTQIPAYKRLMGRYKAEKFYRKFKNSDIHQFLDEYKFKARLRHKITTLHRERIPAEKGVLVLANHPTGIPDGILILDTLLKKRSDVKLIIDVNTYPIDPLKLYTIGVHSDKSPESIHKNALALKEALDWLKDGHCLVLFSNSEINLNRRPYQSSDDSFWHPTARKIITKYDGFILPWAIRGKNSPLFYRLSKISNQFRSDLIPREGLKRRFRPIESVIGKPFKFSDEQSLIDLELKIRLMSKKPQWFDLKNVIPLPKISKWKPLADAIPSEILKAEIAQIGEPLCSKSQNYVYLCPPNKGQSLIKEIGRLRELTFREVGEGTGKSADLDQHDTCFYHLILWDAESDKIAGAYRLGMGEELLSLPDYTPILYEFYKRNAHTDTLLAQSMVMGRAFVVPAYQSKPFPLFLLWNGIMEVLKSRKEIRFLIGQTSLPNAYHRYSKQLITGFLWHHFSDIELREWFTPYHPLKMKSNPLIDSWIKNSSIQDIKRMDKIIECIEPNGDKTPMLFKRYIEQKALCIGINVDPDFQNCIDILMITRVEDLF
jgi:putative hemolysin